MILYKKKVTSIFKVILAIIIFILTMTITFDEVFGDASKKSSPIIEHSVSNVK